MSTAEQRSRMGAAIVNHEARRDKSGRIQVYHPPANDGGGAYEVAGINVRFHPGKAAQLRALIEAGKHAEAEKEAAAYVVLYTNAVTAWHSDPGVEFYLRDAAFNRGPTGAARILQRAVNVPDDGEVGPQTKAAVAKLLPLALLDALRDAREEYEREVVGMRANFEAGLKNRWNKALGDAIKFSAEAPVQPPKKNWLSSLFEMLASFFGKKTTVTIMPKGTADRWMTIALKEEGVKETPGPASTPRVLQIRKEAGCTLPGDDGSVAWCMVFVVWVMQKAGFPIRKQWMARGIETDPDFVRLSGPAKGALVSFYRNGRTSGQGHIAFYAGETLSGKIRCFGANQSDAIRWAFYAKDGVTSGLVGYYWPKSAPLPQVGPVYVDDDGEPVASAE